MSKIHEMRQKRAEVIRGARDILDKAENEKRGLTNEERGSWKELHSQIESIATDIRMLEEQREADRSIEGATPVAGSPIEARGGKVPLERRNMVLRSLLRPDRNPATEEMRADAKSMGIDLRSNEFEVKLMRSDEVRALSVVTPGAGPETIPEGFVPRIETELLAYGGMRNVGAELFRTSSGNDLPIPMGDDTANIGAIIAESTETTGADGSGPDPVFAQTILKAYKYETKAVLVPYELIQDNAVNVEAWLAEQLGIRVGRITNQHFTTGTGTGQPLGVVTASGEGATGALDFDGMLSLIHSVDPAYRSQGARFMFNDNTLLTLKQIKDGDGRYLWQPDLTGGEADRIMGYGYTLNQDMPDHAAAAKSVVFGAFRYFKIRDVASMRFMVLRERWAEKDSIGFLGFSRHDSKCTLTNALKHLAGV